MGRTRDEANNKDLVVFEKTGRTLQQTDVKNL